ncbi:hypothetical protein K501DRAFT_295991 [Backusella circina FSU 941]|nr:hypothetical protein K501DRAFT_295991 [Backusella circina FSU 941]
MSAMGVEEPELSEKMNELLDTLKSIQSLSSRVLRNKLYQHVCKQVYDIVGEYDIGIIENLTRHLKHPLESNTLERSVVLGCYAINKAKWDGILFKVCNHEVSAGLVEFSDGTNVCTNIKNERYDIQKLYKMMSTVFFEKLHLVFTVPTTVKLLLKFISQNPSPTNCMEKCCNQPF